MRGKSRNKVYSSVGVVQSQGQTVPKRSKESEPSHVGEEKLMTSVVTGKEEQRLEQQQTRNTY